MCFLKMRIFLIAGIESEILKIRKIDFVFLLFGSVFQCRFLPDEITCDFRVASIEFVFILGTKFARFGGMPKIIILKNQPEKVIVITQRKKRFL